MKLVKQGFENTTKQANVILKDNNPWKNTKSDWGKTNQDYKDFAHTFLGGNTKDFASSFLPTDDIYGSSGSGVDDVPSLVYFQYLAERRIGIGWRLTRMPADDAIRNRFRITTFKGTIEERDDIFEWCEETDFYNQLAQALYYERVYGIAFLMKYFTENDREKEDFSKSVKKGRKPVAFQAFPPTVMQPTNVYKTFYLDTDPQKWDITGGLYNVGKIDHTRIHVIMTRRVAQRWRGLSVFETAWHSFLSYFQAIIYLLRAFNKLGSMIPMMKIESNMELSELYTKYADLLDEMKMNGIFLGRQGDDINFAPTNIAAGLKEMMEIWIEDICSNCGFPVPIIMGRAQAAGMGSAMYLVFERYYWNTIAHIQASLTDDLLRMFKYIGFENLERRRIDWQIAIVKTDAQRLADELAEQEVKLQKKQLKLMNIQIEREKLQNEMLEFQHLSNVLGQGQNPQEQQGNNDQYQVDQKQFQDFRDLIQKRKDYFKIRRNELVNKMFGIQPITGADQA